MATDNKTPPFGGYLIWERAPKGTWQVRWDAYQALAIIVGVAILFIYAMSKAGWKSAGWLIFGICVLIAAGALAAGLLLGFLFGIPKAAQEPQQQSAPPLNQANAAQTKARLKANTNLVEISDWLTKMIVGVGLFQLSKLPGKLKLVADYFATTDTPSPLVLAILGYFGIFGFLLGYLWARIYLTKEFEQDGDNDDSAQTQRQPGNGDRVA